MRTTLDIDDDVLQAAKEIAANRANTTGRVLSDLARNPLESRQVPQIRDGVRLMPRWAKGSPRSTMEKLNRLRDET